MMIPCTAWTLLLIGAVLCNGSEIRAGRVKRWKGDYYTGGDLSANFRGVAGVDYPDHREIPVTSFSCAAQLYSGGLYADVDTKCQVYHVCHDGRKESFLCGKGTIFNQQILACDYWYSTDCDSAPNYYYLNAEISEGQSQSLTGGGYQPSGSQGRPSQPARPQSTQYQPSGSHAGQRPAGPQGGQGPAGPRGGQGPAGPRGGQGPAGPRGGQGPAGPRGGQGPAGPHGGQGPSGPRGGQGPSGPQGGQYQPGGPYAGQGPAGPHGGQGPTGPQGGQYQPGGPQGGQGPAGPHGGQEPTGPQGGQYQPAGPQGGQGPTGPQGQGPTGPQGGPYAGLRPGGPHGGQGPAGPQGGQYQPGGPYAGQGPAGPQGGQGPAGPQGGQGPGGPHGGQGPTGPQGGQYQPGGPYAGQRPAGPQSGQYQPSSPQSGGGQYRPSQPQSGSVQHQTGRHQSTVITTHHQSTVSQTVTGQTQGGRPGAGGQPGGTQTGSAVYPKPPTTKVKIGSVATGQHSLPDDSFYISNVCEECRRLTLAAQSAGRGQPTGQSFPSLQYQPSGPQSGGVVQSGAIRRTTTTIVQSGPQQPGSGPWSFPSGAMPGMMMMGGPGDR